MTKKKSCVPSTPAESAILAKCVLVFNAIIAPLYANRVEANAPTPPSGYVYFSTHALAEYEGLLFCTRDSCKLVNPDGSKIATRNLQDAG